MGLQKNLLKKLASNLTQDEYLLCQAKAVLLQAMFEHHENHENIFVFDGPNSLLLFIEAAKVFVERKRRAFRFQFIVKVGARAHDVSGDMQLLEADRLDYAIILDANLDNAFLQYLVEKISQSFSIIDKTIISNFQPNREWPYICQQRYGYMCSVFSIDNVVQFASYSSEELVTLFSEKSSPVDGFSPLIQALYSLPVRFMRLAHKPESFHLEVDALETLPYSDLPDKYYVGLQYEDALSYRNGTQCFNVQINRLKEKYAELLLEKPGGFLRIISLNDYHRILRSRFGFAFIADHTPAALLSNSLNIRRDEGALQVTLLSSLAIRSYRLGDIKKFYEFLELIETAPDFTEAEKKEQIAILRFQLFATQAGDFFSNPFLVNKRVAIDVNQSKAPTAMELVGSRELLVQPLFPMPEDVVWHCQYETPRAAPPSKLVGGKMTYFETYDRVHAKNPADPCPDAITLVGEEKHLYKLFLDLYCLLNETPGMVESLGGENTLFLLSIVQKINCELGNHISRPSAFGMMSSSIFLNNLSRARLIEDRHKNSACQRRYDEQFGVLKR